MNTAYKYQKHKCSRIAGYSSTRLEQMLLLRISWLLVVNLYNWGVDLKRIDLSHYRKVLICKFWIFFLLLQDDQMKWYTHNDNPLFYETFISTIEEFRSFLLANSLARFFQGFFIVLSLILSNIFFPGKLMQSFLRSVLLPVNKDIKIQFYPAKLIFSWCFGETYGIENFKYLPYEKWKMLPNVWVCVGTFYFFVIFVTWWLRW